MLRLALPLVLLSACAGRAAPVAAPADARWEAWTWAPGGGGEGTFLVFATSDRARELGQVAAVTGYTVRPSTDEDLRRSWPVLNVRDDRRGVAYQASVPGDVALVNFWVELEVARQAGHEVGVAERFLETLL